jgi:hypothetical protein
MEANMKHVLGMAKSFLDLKGARRPGLELDYLRLVYAVNELRSTGAEAQGYLGVLTPQISERVKRWENKYRGKDSVKVIELSLSSSVKTQLQTEKTNNLAGMRAGVSGGKAGARSRADFSRQTGEDALRGAILKSEPRAKQIKDNSSFPFDVRWDFYGTVD